MLFKKRSTAKSETVTVPNEAPAEVETVTAPEVGNVIPFAGYDWRVLDVQDGKALLISKYILKVKVYNDSRYAGLTWNTCTLRRYLNVDFYCSLPADRALISETQVVNNDNPKHETPGGVDTIDKIFLLSIEEAEAYFGSNEERVAYACDRFGIAWIRKDKSKKWWLRSPSESNYHAVFVDDKGGIIVDGCAVDECYVVGVRPALWLNLHSYKPPAQKAKPLPMKAPAKGEVGSVIPFAGYDWRVLDVKDGKALFISENILGFKEYEESDSTTWEKCRLRSYLKDFFDSLPAETRARISETQVVNNDNPKYGTPGGEDTTDKIFLLSIEEAEAYFGSDKERVAYFFLSNSPINSLGKRQRPWWLRSPGKEADSAAYVGANGSIIVKGEEFYRAGYPDDIYGEGGSDGSYASNGVRPALWLNLE
jgi:hypothetical protein